MDDPADLPKDPGVQAQLLRPVRALAFDLDGTIYLGHRLLPGSLDLLSALRHAPLPVVFATNNSSKTPDQYLAHLAAFGLNVQAGEVLTSNQVAVDELRAAGVRRPFVVANKAVADYYRSEGFELDASDPDAVLLTFDTSLDYEKLKRADALIRTGIRYYATHPDLTCPTADGPIPDCGAFAALLAASAGAWPVVLGKPEAAMARSIVQRLGLPGSAVAFVGDRLYTDIRMAREQGLVGVLTLTGEATLADLADAPYSPDVIVEDMNHLHALLRLAEVIA